MSLSFKKFATFTSVGGCFSDILSVPFCRGFNFTQFFVISSAFSERAVQFVYICQNSHILLHPHIAKHGKFNLLSGEPTGTYRFLTGFYGLIDMAAEFQKAFGSTLVGLTNTHCFLDDVFIVSKGSQSEHLELVHKCRDKLDQENFAINLKNVIFLKMILFSSVIT